MCRYCSYLFLFSYLEHRHDPIPRPDFESLILEPLYQSEDQLTLGSIHSHRLSIFFILMATGLLTDHQPAVRTRSEQYHALARAAFSVDSIVREATCDSVQAVFMMIYYGYLVDRSSTEIRWILSGLAARLAQMVSLFWYERVSSVT